VQDECSKYGQILDLKIPRPTGGSRQSAGVGKIFVKFGDVDSATKALKALAGRKFSDRTVVTTYFSEVSSTCLRYNYIYIHIYMTILSNDTPLTLQQESFEVDAW
jgi:hypothetical protein